MDSEIAFLVASSFHSGYLPSLLAERRLFCPVYGPPRNRVFTDEEALQTAYRMVDEGVKVIITAGRYPELLMPKLPVPVVTLNYSTISFAKAVSAAKKISKKVGFFLRYGRIYNIALMYKSTFRDNVLLAGFEDDRDAGKALEYLRANHVEVIICGGRGKILMEKYGYSFEFVRVTYEPSDLTFAMEEAEQILQFSRKSDLQSRMLRMTQNAVDCGILSVDESGIVAEANEAALALMNTTAEEILHKPMDAISMRQLLPLLQKETKMMPVSVNGNLLLASSQKIQLGAAEDSTVITLLGSEAVREGEQRLKIARIPIVPIENVSLFLTSQNAGFQRILKMAEYYASSESPVFLYGPTGSACSQMAYYIHQKSARKNGPFITVNCAALSDEIQTGTFLFGSRTQTKHVIGQLELAEEGTLFFKNISELPLRYQADLLSAIESGRIIEKATGKTIPLNVRIIASDRRQLLQAVSDGRFREDLFYRLSGFYLRMPSLAERPEDIPDILRQLIARKAAEKGVPVPAISAEASSYFASLAYPGNFYQLTGIAEKILALSNGTTVGIHMAQIVSDMPKEAPSAVMQAERTGNTDARAIREALMANNGKRAETARQLGISTATLWRKMKLYGLLPQTESP